MDSNKYYFQVIDSVPGHFETELEPPFSTFYVEYPNLGNVPIYFRTPGEQTWWYLDEDKIESDIGRTERPTDNLVEVLERITSSPPFIRYDNDLSAFSARVTVSEDILEDLPQHERDFLLHLLDLVQSGQDLPAQMVEYLEFVQPKERLSGTSVQPEGIAGQTVELEVREAYDTDHGRSIARLDPDTMLELDVSPGDFLLISGDRDVIAKVWRSDTEDWGETSVLIDKYLMANAEVDLNDEVTIKPISPENLDRVHLLNCSPGIEFEITDHIEQKIKDQLVKRPIRVNDFIPIATSDSDDWQDAINLMVTNASEAEIGKITEKTCVSISNQYVIEPPSNQAQ